MGKGRFGMVSFSRAFAASLLLIAAAIRPVDGQGQTKATRWTTAWSTSQQGLSENAISDATIRMIARVTIPGDVVRIRLDNAFGAEPVTIGHAYIGYRVQGAALAVGSNRQLTFDGSATATIPAGGALWSDSMLLKVREQQDLAVSLFIPGMNVKPSQHNNGVVTSYKTADGGGDAASNETSAPFAKTTTALWWLKAVEVESASSSGAIVAFGDSITDGRCSTLDAHDRWEDIFSMRFALEHNAAARSGHAADPSLKAVLNEGIGGNTITREGLKPAPDSPSGLERLDRDVLSHHGVTDVVLFMGTNDIARGASAVSVIEGMLAIIRRVKSQGIRIVGVTIIPRYDTERPGRDYGWSAQKTRIRNEVNQWIRTKAAFDGVIDFDKVVRDPSNPELIYSPFNCGDNVHPSPAAYYEMGKSIDLGLFARPAK